MENTEQVQSPQPQPSPVQPVEQKLYGKKNWKKWVLIYIVLAVVIYAGVYYFIQSRQGSNPYSVTYPSVTPQPTLTPDPTSNWQIYNNIKYNYTVKYPRDWEIVDVHTNEKVTFSGKGIVGDKPPLVSIRVFETAKFSKDDIPSYSPYDYKILEKDGYTYFFVASTYQIGSNASPETEEEAKDVLNKVYSTFKFTDQTNTDTSNWKLYTNSELNVSLKLPPTWKASSSVKIIGDSSFEFIVGDQKYNTDPKCLGDCPSFYIKFSMQENTSNQNLDSVIEALEVKTHNKDAVISDILLDNYPAKRIDHLSGEAESSIYVIFKGKIYKILTVVYSDSKESQRAKNDLILADQVFSTLKFMQ